MVFGADTSFRQKPSSQRNALAGTRRCSVGFFCVALLTGPIACNSQPADPPGARHAAASPASAASSAGLAKPPATAPAQVAYDGSKFGFQLSFPSNWKPKASEDFTLLLLPADAPATSARDTDLAGSKISLDVPDLPPHLPGMITLGPMEWHYLSEQKGRFVDLKVTEKTDLTVPKTSTRRLVVSGHAKNADGSAGPAYTVVTLLEIHSDCVYLVSAEAKSKEYPGVRAAFDQVVASMQWVK